MARVQYLTGSRRVEVRTFLFSLQQRGKGPENRSEKRELRNAALTCCVVTSIFETEWNRTFFRPLLNMQIRENLHCESIQLVQCADHTKGALRNTRIMHGVCGRWREHRPPTRFSLCAHRSPRWRHYCHSVSMETSVTSFVYVTIVQTKLFD